VTWNENGEPVVLAEAVSALVMAGGWRSILRSSNSTVECHDSMTAVSRADRGRPIDWAIPSRWQAAWNARAVYSLP